jgi:hypothetical protein
MGIRTARDNWLKIGDSLRKYDIALEEARRTSGVQLSKDVVQKLISRFAYASRIALKKSKQNICPRLAAESNAIIIDKIIDDLLGEVWLSAMNDLMGESVPDWLKKDVLAEIERVKAE